MQLAMHATILSTRRALLPLVAGLFALATVSPTAAQAKARKKPAPVENATPKKKTPPTTPPAKTSKSEADLKAAPSAKSSSAPNASIAPEQLIEFHAQPAGVRKLIEFSLELARQNLTYTFGSADPAKGGFDCSGFIYYVLRQHGLTQVPRDSSGLYVWARKARGFRAVIGRKSDSFEMDELLPGDLLFWTGTFVTDHDPPVTHTMIYLGTEKSTGAKVMIGSSDGRIYHGEKRNGVSVFDFTMPRTSAANEQRATFVGYARIPGLRD